MPDEKPHQVTSRLWWFWREHRLFGGFLLVVMLAVATTIGHVLGYTVPLPAVLALLCWLTAVVTRRAGRADPVVRGRALWAQLSACALVFLAAGLEGARLNGALPAGFQVPLWSDVYGWFIAGPVGGAFGVSFANGVANLLLYCVPIGVVLLALSVPLRGLGFGHFRRGSAATAVIWLLVPVSVTVALLFNGALTAPAAGALLLNNLLNNGFSEEFLFRGVIFGRLRAVMSDNKALLLQAVLFGVWHFGTDYVGNGGNLGGMALEMVTVQMVIGLAMGYLTLRTGNIAISSAAHMFLDALNSLGVLP